MSKLLIRHAEVDSTHLLSGDMDLPLSGRGYRQAELLGTNLRAAGLDLGGVAVSEALRTQETARTMGATRIVTYPLLNEVTHEGMSKEEVRNRLRKGWLPITALDAARNILEDPPTEDIIVTHELVIAGLTVLTSLREGLVIENYPLCPELCDTRRLDI